MKISEQWLREWIDLPLDDQQLADQLSLAGIEVDSVLPVAGEFSQVVVGQIKQVEPHPNASRLQVCQVDIGEEKLLSIVCGAPNARAGLKVAVAKMGAKLPNNVHIKKTQLRGVLSEGMLCSCAELELSKESAGILELPQDAPLGKDLYDYLQLNDHIFDIHVTPNRGDCLSVLGLTRELAALNDQRFSPKIIERTVVPTLKDQFTVKVLDSDDCLHYSGVIIKGINTQAQTPLWMSERLRRSGFRTIHPVVDVTNYVLLELGQPLHAFDLQCLDTEIVVRRAHSNEQLKLLDGNSVTLDTDTLVIADKKRAQAIAGVMGGFNSAVTTTTTSIFLESASFNPERIQGKARQYNLSSESAYRFERGVDSNLTEKGLLRAIELLSNIVGGQYGPISSVQTAKKSTKPILLRQSRIEKLLGIKISETEITSILQRLGMQCKLIEVGVNKQSQAVFEVTIPTWRFDLKEEIDLIEEVARVHGYNQINESLPTSIVHFNPISKNHYDVLRQFLAHSGYQEAINYSFTAPDLQKRLDPAANSISLLNPISKDLSVMRTTLWSGLLQAVNYNQKRQQPRVRLFEIGVCFQHFAWHSYSHPLKNQQQTKFEATNLLQRPFLAGVATGDVFPEQWGEKDKPLDFYDIKANVESLLHLNNAHSQVKFESVNHPALHPGQAAGLITKHGQNIGYLGALHPEHVERLALQGPVFLFEIALDELLPSSVKHFNPFSKFPIVRRDISFWSVTNIPAQQLLEQAKKLAGPYLHQAYFFDVYQNEQKEPEQRSLALALLWQHPTRTLVDSEVDELLNQVIQGLQQQFAIQLRE